MKRLRTYWSNSDFSSRVRLLLLIGLPLWVCSLPLFHFALAPWLAGFFLPRLLIGLLLKQPRLQTFLLLAMMGSCLLIFVVFPESGLVKEYTWQACGWLWFCLAFAAGVQFWMTSEPGPQAELERLNQNLTASLEKLRRGMEPEGEKTDG